jgi:hypothetical protein
LSELADILELRKAIEANQINPEIALQYLLSQLINHAKAFQDLAAQTQLLLNQLLANTISLNKEFIKAIIWQHISQSDYAARLMEIAIHSLMQAMQEYNQCLNSIFNN